jgi:histidyl-tRNA synthetase
VASGGRYDELYGLFGQSRPAAGAAIQVDDLAWALSHHGEQDVKRVLFLTGNSEESVEDGNILQGLREGGVIVAPFSGPSALDYARWWRYSHLARSVPGTQDALLLDLRSEAGSKEDWSKATPISLLQLLEQLNT